MSKATRRSGDFMNDRWRPMMGVMYMTVCIFDFIVFPIGFTTVQFWEVEAANDAFRQWNPLTLSGGGLFHLAMGAVLGISAFSQGKENIAGVGNPPPAPPAATPEYSEFPPPPPRPAM